MLVVTNRQIPNFVATLGFLEWNLYSGPVLVQQYCPTGPVLRATMAGYQATLPKNLWSLYELTRRGVLTPVGNLTQKELPTAVAPQGNPTGMGELLRQTVAQSPGACPGLRALRAKLLDVKAEDSETLLDFRKSANVLKFQARPQHLIPQKTQATGFRLPYLIDKAPMEITHGGDTYRILLLKDTTNSVLSIAWMAKQDDPEYDLLDAGNMLYLFQPADDIVQYDSMVGLLAGEQIGERRVHVVTRLTPDLVKYYCLLQSIKSSALVNPEVRAGVHIPPNQAAARLLRLLRELKKPQEGSSLANSEYLTRYEKYLGYLQEDLRQTGALSGFYRVEEGAQESTKVQDITFGRNSLTYESISIEADGLLSDLMESHDLTGDLEVYVLGRTIVDKFVDRCELALAEARKARKIVAVEGPATPVDPDALPTPPPADEPESSMLPLGTIRINQYPINLQASLKSGSHQINGVRIHAGELRDVIARALCHDTQEGFEKFCRSVSKLCLRWHNVLANGLQVKIHANITENEYKAKEPGEAAPKLRFFRDLDTNKIFLKLSDTEKVPVNFHKLLSRVRSINSQTNNGALNQKDRDALGLTEGNGVFEGRYFDVASTGQRGFQWARIRLAKAIHETTAQKDGTEVLSYERIKEILGAAEQDHLAAIRKSYELLEKTVERIGAEVCEYKGEPAYKVKGARNTYVVMKKDSKVYNFTTGSYICIVNSRNYKGIGFDDVVARLLALKNDSVTQARIHTLQGCDA